MKLLDIFYKFDLYGYSKFFTLNKNYNFKTRLMGFVCLSFIIYVITTLIILVHNFLLDQKVQQIIYEKNPGSSKNVLPIQNYPIFFEFFAFKTYPKNSYSDIDRILQHEVYLSGKKLGLEKCSEANLNLYSTKFFKMDSSSLILSKNNLFCLNFDKNSNDTLINFENDLIIRSQFCDNTVNNNCFDNQLLQQLQIQVRLTLFRFDPLLYSHKTEEITPVSFMFQQNQDGNIYKEISITNLFINSFEGFINQSLVRYTLPQTKIRDLTFGSSMIEFTFKLEKESDQYTRIYEKIIDIFVKVGGLLHFVNYLALIVQFTYENLFVINTYDILLNYANSNENYKINSKLNLPSHSLKKFESQNENLISLKKPILQDKLLINKSKFTFKDFFCFCIRKKKNSYKKVNESIKNILSVENILMMTLLFKDKCEHKQFKNFHAVINEITQFNYEGRQKDFSKIESQNNQNLDNLFGIKNIKEQNSK